MTTKTVTALEELLNSDHASKLKDYRGILARRKEAIPIIRQMPPALANIAWFTFLKLSDHTWFLDTWVLSDTKEADAIIKELKIIGIHGLKSAYRNFSNSWTYNGSIQIGAITINIRVDGGSKPPNCRIEETLEMKEVITYKAICEDTEEEV